MSAALDPTAFVLAATVAAGAPCFDTKLVFEAAERKGLELRWDGVEAMPYNFGTKIHFFWSPDGERWEIWSIAGDEGCLISKGIEGRRRASRPYLR